jgi:L,D-transpeptidase catalytic domain
MRRLVVISGKSKILAFVAITVFSLTSIHLAAKAHIASLQRDHGQVLKTYPIAVGARGTPSPDGDFVIINHAKDPIYRGGDMEIPPGKDNPLGTRWMGLSLKGYGIHGTNVQSSVGKAISHGCFRMRKQDVEELYTLVQVGDTVMVRRERDAMTAKVFAAPTPAQPAVTLAATTNSEVAPAAAVPTTVETTEQ